MKKKKDLAQKEVERFDVDINNGLTTEQVKKRIENKETNLSISPTNKTYAQIILGNIFTSFNILMFTIAVILYLIIGPRVITNLAFLLISLANILIGTIQECKSKHTIEKLKLLTDSKTRVIRDGKEELIHPNDIVLDELIILSSGDQIPVDAIILEDEVLEVNESLLTGESVPVKKSKGNMVFAGSFVVSGLIKVRAEKIANDTYLKSIENKAKMTKKTHSHLMVSIYRIIRTLTIIAIPLAIVVFFNEFFYKVVNNTEGLKMIPSFWGEESIITNAVFYGGTTITYMIPYGMALLASVAMTTGVVKLAQEKTLAQDLYSVESLSRVDTLCLDKTGTLTDGTMTVEKMVNLSKLKDKEIETLMGSFLKSFKTFNQTSTALKDKYPLNDEYEHEDNVEFNSDRKYSAVKFKKMGWFILGAPDYLTSDENILKEVNDYAYNGLRVVMLAKVNGELDITKKCLDIEKENIALFVIRDTIRPEVKDTMYWFDDNDVAIRVISGDNVATVSHIAKESGIKNYDKIFDMSKLKPGEDLEEIVLTHYIFGRVSPEQKAEIIAILRKHEHVVGVTGDGLNDLLAFKQADCSIALSTGAAATKNVANLVLLDNDFSHMKEAVYQGRRVVNNIQRSSSLFVMKDFLWLFITVLPIVLGVNHVIQPTIMTIVNVFITGIASLFVALEPDRSRVTGDFYKNVIRKSMASAFYMFVPILVVMVYFIISSIVMNGTFNMNDMKTVFENGEIVKLGWIPVLSVMTTISGFVIFFDCCRPFTKFRKILFGVILGVVVLILYLMPEFFIISGTDMLKEVGGIMNMPKYIITHFGANATLALYRTMNLEQIIALCVHLVVVFPTYNAIKKLIGIIINKFFTHEIDIHPYQK